MADAFSVQQPVIARARSVVLGLVFLATTVVALGYHLLSWQAGSLGGVVLTTLYHCVVVVGYGALWVLLSEELVRNRPSPARALWILAIAATTVIVVSTLVLLIGRPSFTIEGALPAQLLGFDLESGTPLVLATVFKMNILSLLQGMFAVLLMLRLRDLVLVKRTRTSQRNWRIMVILMVLTSLSAVANRAGTDLNVIQTVLMVSAVGFMVVNSFRLSWIVFLSFREKMATIGLSVLVLLLLVAGIGVMSDSPIFRSYLPGSYAFVEYFSYPLAMFASQTAIFGILYCTTAFLSLLFHLPTTGEFEQRAGERAAMQTLTHIVGGVFDSQQLMKAITAAPVEAGAAHTTWLALADPDSGSLRPRLAAAHRISDDRIRELLDFEALYDEVRSTGKMLVLGQAAADHRVRAKPGDGVASLIVAPLIARDRMLGALFAAKDVVIGFERDEIGTVGLLAAQAAIAIENARLFEQQVEKERLARELSIAREVQKRLLPQQVPSIRGMSIAASSVPAQEVGGDYYDFVQIDEDRLGIIIADVSGKGTSAAFYMAEMQGIFQSVSRLVPSPRDFLHHANVALADSLDRNVFISVVYGVLDIEREELVLARAGHCPVAVVDLEGHSRFLRTRGIGLGLDRTSLFRNSLGEERVALQPGDVFVLYTDGVVESRNDSGDEYGYDRLLDVLAEHRHEDARDIHASVIRELNKFTGGKEYDDDMTLLVLKWHGLPLGAVDRRPEMAESTART